MSCGYPIVEISLWSTVTSAAGCSPEHVHEVALVMTLSSGLLGDESVDMWHKDKMSSL